jgi:hypothetical protein
LKELKFEKFGKEFNFKNLKKFERKKNKQNPNPLLSLSSRFGPAQPPSLFSLLAQLARSGPPPLLSLSQPPASFLSRARCGPTPFTRPITAQQPSAPPPLSSATDRLGPLVRVIPFLRSAPPSLPLFWTSSAAAGHLLRIPHPFPPSSRHQGALMHRFYPPHQFSIRFSLIKCPLDCLEATGRRHGH